MKAFGIITNILIPGVGSFIVGKAGQGVAQILLWGLGFLFTVFTFGFGGVIGIPLMLGAWIWGLITAIGTEPQSITVNVNTTETGQ